MSQTDKSPKDERDIVFISYAHIDNEPERDPTPWLDVLLEHLHSVQLETHCSLWSDKDISPGDDWHDKIQSSIAGSSVAVLMVSPAFLRSQYIREYEMPPLLETRDRGALRIIPLVIRYSSLDGDSYRYPDPEEGPKKLSLSSLQMPTPPSEPLSKLEDSKRDEVLSKLVSFIKSPSHADADPPTAVRNGDQSEPEPPRGSASETNPSATDQDQPPTEQQPLREESRRRAPFTAATGLWIVLGVLLMVTVLFLLFGPGNGGGEPQGQSRPTVLFGNPSASDIERLQGATEVDIVRLAMECESEQIRGLGTALEDRPKALLQVSELMIKAHSAQGAAGLELSAPDRRRLTEATEIDVVQLALKCECDFIRQLAEIFEKEPALLLIIVNELIK